MISVISIARLQCYDSLLCSSPEYERPQRKNYR